MARSDTGALRRSRPCLLETGTRTQCPCRTLFSLQSARLLSGRHGAARWGSFRPYPTDAESEPAARARRPQRPAPGAWKPTGAAHAWQGSCQLPGGATSRRAMPKGRNDKTKPRGAQFSRVQLGSQITACGYIGALCPVPKVTSELEPTPAARAPHVPAAWAGPGRTRTTCHAARSARLPCCVPGTGTGAGGVRDGGKARLQRRRRLLRCLRLLR